VATFEYGQRVDNGVGTSVLPADVLRRVPAGLHYAAVTPHQAAHGPYSKSGVDRAAHFISRLIRQIGTAVSCSANRRWSLHGFSAVSGKTVRVV